MDGRTTPMPGCCSTPGGTRSRAIDGLLRSRDAHRCHSRFHLDPAAHAAVACDRAEQLRLAEEQKKLAGRNAWTGSSGPTRACWGPDASSSSISTSSVRNPPRYLGKTWEQYERLKLSVALDPQPEILDSLDAIDEAYGRIEIQGTRGAGRSWCATRCRSPPTSARASSGPRRWCPRRGPSTACSRRASMSSGRSRSPSWRGRPSRPSPSVGSAERWFEHRRHAGFLRYAHVVSTVGPSFLATPETGKAPTLDDGEHQFAPSDRVRVGVLGAARRRAGSDLRGAGPGGWGRILGYTGGYGTDTLHGLSAWFAGWRAPAISGIAAGPMFQTVIGSAPGWPRGSIAGTIPSRIPTRRSCTRVSRGVLACKRRSATVYWTLTRSQGVVEVGGSWQSDGARSYYGFGLRVGIVPTVPRFEG